MGSKATDLQAEVASAAASLLASVRHLAKELGELPDPVHNKQLLETLQELLREEQPLSDGLKAVIDAATSDEGADGPLGLAPNLPPMALGPRGVKYDAYLQGFLHRPYAQQLAAAAAAWRITGDFPYPSVERKRPGMLQEGPEYVFSKAEAKELIGSLLKPAEGVASAGGSCWQVDLPSLEALLRSGPMTMLLLGLRITTGSAKQLLRMPSLNECWAAFEELNSPGTKCPMTVGCRALAKHCHRDLEGEWWPKLSGSVPSKNAVARDTLGRLLRGAVWLNLHQLPPFDAPTYVLEMRTTLGYGARWAIQPDAAKAAEAAGAGTGTDAVTAASTSSPHYSVLFRGFLEPQMEDGHAAGWRH